IKDELEDAAFAITHPEERAELRALLGERQGEMLVNTATRELQEALEASQFRELSSLRVSGRAKSAYSTWKKMNKKNLRFHEIWDRMAIRVILDAPSAERARQLCFEVRDVVAGLWKLVEGRSKDYVSNPKAPGPGLDFWLHFV
ncbi:RSH3, partial [Symbiodinium necroappetens]